MKDLRKHLTGMISLVLAAALLPVGSLACTAVYIGRDASEDGTTIVARCNDYPDIWPNYVEVVPAVENEPGRTMPVGNKGTVFAPIPAHTYQYTSTPMMDAATSYNGYQPDAAACANEMGVVMTMSVTAFSNEAALAADPLVEGGLTEYTANDLVICQSATAREAVQVLTGLIDTYGSSECNVALIADQTETWYVEMYTGHQYAAVLLPTDKVSVFGNEFTLEYLSDYADRITSAELEALPAENGFAVYGENGELCLFDTYAGTELAASYCHMRTWIGHRLLSADTPEDFNLEDRYPLVFTADHKVSVNEVMSIMRNRYEGTEYSPDETGRTDMRVIGTDTSLSVHVLQIYADLPAEMSCVTWESAGPAIYGVFVPVSNLCDAVSESYSRNQPAEDFGQFDTDTYPWYAFKELAVLCLTNVEALGKPVSSFWAEAERKMTAGMDQVLRSAAAMTHDDAVAYVTDYCTRMQERAFSDAKSILNSVVWYMCRISNTMKRGINPETREVLDDLKSFDPVTLTVTTDGYGV